MAIERIAYPRPWTRDQFLHEINAPYSRVELSLIQDQVAGYICFWSAAGEMHILNIATSPDFYRMGVARHLISQAFNLAEQDSLEVACLEVRTGNTGAIALYRELGFTDDCIRRHYYADGEDALLMSRMFEKKTNDGA